MQNVINDVKESIELETSQEIMEEGKEVVEALETLRDEVKNDAILEYTPHCRRVSAVAHTFLFLCHHSSFHVTKLTFTDPLRMNMTQQSNPGTPNSLALAQKQLTFPAPGST